jgi:hypothetical protein
MPSKTCSNSALTAKPVGYPRMIALYGGRCLRRRKAVSAISRASGMPTRLTCDKAVAATPRAPQSEMTPIVFTLPTGTVTRPADGARGGGARASSRSTTMFGL